MAFEDNRKAYAQEHFTIVEIDLPVVEGSCTLGGSPGFGTPMTCDEPITGTKTYKFTDYIGVLPESGIYKCLGKISENPTELQSGRGLARRGSASIKLTDFSGDPNPLAPAVSEEVKRTGGFLAKMDARNILVNRQVRIKNYRIINGLLPDLNNDAQVRHYISDSFTSNGKDQWTLKCKDELSRVDLEEQLFPKPNNGFLRTSATELDLVFDVDSDTNYQPGDVIRIGEELINITAVSNIGTNFAQIQTNQRTGSIDNRRHRSEVSEHESGEEIFLCKLYSNARIYDVIYEILTSSGIPPEVIPLSDWQNEINTWHATTRIFALYVESEDVNNVISKICESYMLDIWFDPVDREIKLTAISVWQSSVAQLNEGVEIDYDSVKRQEVENLRATNALVVYDKPFKAKDDSIENYRKAKVFENPKLSTDAFYSEQKQKRFANNPLIDDIAAELLVRRYISRYGVTPQSYTWTTQENKLSFKTGDVVSLRTSSKVGFDGSPNASARAQIISIKPKYGMGREYQVKAITYDPAITDGGITVNQVLTGSLANVNLFIEAGGAIPSPVELTFILDGAKISSQSTATPAIRAGAFPAGSKIILVLINGAEMQSIGGRGGTAGGVVELPETNVILRGGNGGNGGIVYSADGIDTDIYLSGSTPPGILVDADGYLRAPGGGGGGSGPIVSTRTNGNGGGGGAGTDPGLGGLIPSSTDYSGGVIGGDGNNSGSGGTGSGAAGNGGNWGQNGQNGTSVNSGQGGLAGKGIVLSGATVNIYGFDTQRLINGGGDTPNIVS